MNFDFEKFKYYLGLRESSNNYDPPNSPPGMFGKYQFSAATLNYLKDKYELQDWFNSNYFISNPDLQEKYFSKHIPDILNYIQAHGYDVKYTGIYKTAAHGAAGKLNVYGMVAAAHLSGKGGLSNYLEHGKDPSDGHTNVSDYAVEFSNYFPDAGSEILAGFNLKSFFMWLFFFLY